VSLIFILLAMFYVYVLLSLFRERLHVMTDILYKI